MKMRKVLPVMLLAATALTGCAKEVSYADFNAKAKAAEADTYVSASARVKGSKRYEGASVTLDKTITFNKTLGVWAPTDLKLDGEYAFVTIMLNAHANAVAETEGYKYYLDGSSFQVKNETSTTKYDKYGCFTSYSEKGDTSNYTITVKYSK